MKYRINIYICTSVSNTHARVNVLRIKFKSKETEDFLLSGKSTSRSNSKCSLQLSPLRFLRSLIASPANVSWTASRQHGTNQYWFIINKKIQHFLLGKLARLVMGTIF